MAHHKKKGNIKEELKEHIPFTGLASLIATALITLILLIYKQQFLAISENLFEIFHPLHIILSAFVTTEVYYN